MRGARTNTPHLMVSTLANGSRNNIYDADLVSQVRYVYGKTVEQERRVELSKIDFLLNISDDIFEHHH